MVITRLIGGLGNQMFQYAVGRRLAHSLGVKLKLDITEFDDYKPRTFRTYSLGNFNIQENFASLKEIAALKKPGTIEQVRVKLLHRPAIPPSTYICEKKDGHFDPGIMKLPDNVYLEGYWQSEKYFIDIAEIIRREFTVKVPQIGKNKELGEEIVSCESVSLHIRRGDYVSDAHTNKVHGCCGIDYYLRCVKLMNTKVKNAHFFAFSDEPEWVCDNLKLPYPMTVIDHNGADKGYEDLRLMSQCRHHIISNSSFSWWGAWLNPRKDKKVFAPKQWFGKEKQATRRIDDLTPATWVLA